MYFVTKFTSLILLYYELNIKKVDHLIKNQRIKLAVIYL